MKSQPDATSFLWRRPLTQEGYHWVKITPSEPGQPEQPYRRVKPQEWSSSEHPDVWSLVPGDETRLGTYAPLEEERALFRVFSELEQTPAGVLAFANRYGPLRRWLENTENEFFDDVTGKNRAIVRLDVPGMPPGEPLGYWLIAILDMSDNVKIWDMIKARDQCGLAKHFKRDGSTIVWRDLGAMRPDGSFALGGAAVAIAPGDLVTPARMWLGSRISTDMAARVSRILVLDHHKGKEVMRTHPHDLLGAMYLQFALAVAANKDYRRCTVCNKWMELSPQVNRADRLTCSNGCRMLQYRQRQERARELHAQGKTPRQIAAELESDVATIKGWIKKGK